MPASSRRPRIGLALGGGSARGWAHIGVIRALADIGVTPDVICGTSIGALIGAIHAHNDLDWLENWVTDLTLRQVLRLLDVRWGGGGLLGGAKLLDIFSNRFSGCRIEDLATPFSAVATDLDTGHEIWLQEGDTVQAVRASIAIPGLFTPVERDGMWLVDGGLVNPVPVSLARAMGATIVIAVDINTDIVTRSVFEPASEPSEEAGAKPVANGLTTRFRQWFGGSSQNVDPDVLVKRERAMFPRMVSSLEKAINIMEVRIARSRLAGEPPDILITPRLGHIGLMEFHRAVPAIAEGRAAVERVSPEIRARLGLSQ